MVGSPSDGRSEGNVEHDHGRAMQRIVEIANESIRARGWFRVALSGGISPCALYERLAACGGETEFGRWEVFFTDERWLRPESRDTSYHRAFDSFLGRVPIQRARVHRIRTEAPSPAAAAEDYERELCRALGARGDGVPRLDLVVLDEAEHAAVPRDDSGLVAAEWDADEGLHRVTLTPRAVSAARRVLFVADDDREARSDPRR